MLACWEGEREWLSRSAGHSLILRLAFQNTYVAIHASPSLPVLAFTFAIAVLTGILFRCCSRVDNGQCGSCGCASRRGPFH